ncbi:MAG: hypothetical protein KKA32_18325, partial [Actinobacteria bacterium]|nr:hypothetical protein [Actinomycetota bacterium]
QALPGLRRTHFRNRCLLHRPLLRPKTASAALLRRGERGSSNGLTKYSYALAVVWGVGAVYLIRDYFTRYFVKSPFAPPQWGFV